MMIGKMMKVGSAVLCCAGLLANAGCACGESKADCVKTVKTTYKPAPPACGDVHETLAALPPNAKPGECWAKVYVPPTFRTVSERVQVKPASDELEIVPAKYEWVEERILVKDASKELAIQPAQFEDRERTIQTYAGSRDWEVTKADNCDFPKNQPAKDVFCLVDRPPEHKTIRETHQVKPPTIEEKCVAAEYTTVRRQKLVQAATTRRIPIPAEFATVEKQVKVCDARMAWQRVVCEEPHGRAVTANKPLESIARAD